MGNEAFKIENVACKTGNEAFKIENGAFKTENEEFKTERAWIEVNVENLRHIVKTQLI